MSPIREGREADVPALRRIQDAALSAPWPDVLEAAATGSALLLVHTGPAAAGGDEPVGYAVALSATDPVYVPELAVAPARQGEGLGSDLLAGLLERLTAAGRERVRLTARADDERARGFYERHGFAVVEELPDHYDDGDGVLYERRLSEAGDADTGAF